MELGRKESMLRTIFGIMRFCVHFAVPSVFFTIKSALKDKKILLLIEQCKMIFSFSLQIIISFFVKFHIDGDQVSLFGRFISVVT